MEKNLIEVIRTIDFAPALGGAINPEKFRTIIINMIANNPALKNCNRNSLLTAVHNCAALGLSPARQLGQVYFVPFNNKGETNCELIIGYRGMISLIARAGIRGVRAECVYAGDYFDVQLGTRPEIKHAPKIDGERGAMIGAYACVTVNGNDFVSWMTRGEIEKHRDKYSRAKTGPWTDNFPEMAKKTVIRRLVKTLPLEDHIAEAISVSERKSDEKDVTPELKKIEEQNNVENQENDGEYES